jgi:hypothetical protein
MKCPTRLIRDGVIFDVSLSKKVNLPRKAQIDNIGGWDSAAEDPTTLTPTLGVTTTRATTTIRATSTPAATTTGAMPTPAATTVGATRLLLPPATLVVMVLMDSLGAIRLSVTVTRMRVRRTAEFGEEDSLCWYYVTLHATEAAHLDAHVERVRSRYEL